MTGPASSGPASSGPAASGPALSGSASSGPALSGSASSGPGLPDRISLTGLRVRGHHGVFDFERADGQDFVVDVELELDTRTAAASDELSDTVHYGELAEALAAVIAGDPVNLLETLAGRLAGVCLADARVAAATVTVHKPQAPIPLQFADVAVTIRRSRAGLAPGATP